MKYVYTAVFSPAENGMITASIPDLPGCITEGNGIVDAIEMITDAAEMWLWDAEINREAIPAASALEDIRPKNVQQRAWYCWIPTPIVELTTANPSANPLPSPNG